MRKAQRVRVAVPLRDYCGNFLHNITHADGSARCAAGLAWPVRDHRYGRNEVIGYKLTEQVRASNSETTMPVITPGEMQANVMHSRTVRLPEWDTRGRDSKHAREMAADPNQPAEDFVELAQQKILKWKVVPQWNPKRVPWMDHAGRLAARA